MSIRLKFIAAVLPLLVASVVLAGAASYFAAAASVTRVAVDFLDFKASELEKYAESQWNLLADNGYVGRSDMEAAAKSAVAAFARSILRSDTETILAVDSAGALSLREGPAVPTEDELRTLAADRSAADRGFVPLRVAGVQRVAATFPFAPFGWQLFVSEERSVFYGDVETIARTTLYVLIGAAALGVILLLVLTGYLTKPLEGVVQAMRRIIQSNDLSERVPVLYKDEIGQLSHTFNLMIQELDGAYEKIKRYAFDAVVAQKRETKIRNIFQLYVPADVIDQVFVNPESMLVGDNRDVSILFSDIRSFTSISERMAPDALVDSLNRYFSTMVDIVMARDGIVDKYIGDAIMAVFGAPVSHGNDALSSVKAGLEMSAALDSFNEGQRKLGAPEFRIGVGIAYGVVTVGNIGCDKKMNYTVIGDTVNLASRLEGLTKKYQEPILFSQSVYEELRDAVPCRVIDRVAVKGKTQGIAIYTARQELSAAQAEAWKIHAEAAERYYGRDFAAAETLFGRTLELLGDDPAAQRFLERTRAYRRAPPPEAWDGVEVMTEK